MKQKTMPPPKGGRRRKWALGTGLVLAGFVAMVWTTGFILESSDLPRRWIEARVNGMVDGRLSLGKVSVSLLSGRIQADRIVFREPGGTERIATDRLLLDLAWWGLAGRTILLETVEVDRLHVRLNRGADGRIDLVESLTPHGQTPPPSSEPTSPSWNVILQSLTVNDGRVAISDAVSAVAVEMDGISVQASGDAASRSVEADIGWARATFDTENRSVPLGSGRWQGTLWPGPARSVESKNRRWPGPFVDFRSCDRNPR